MKLNFVQRAAARVLRKAIIAQRRYHGAKVSRLTADWSTTLITEDKDLKRDLRKLIERSRDLEKGDGVVERALLLIEDNVIGADGVRMQNKARLEKAGKDGKVGYDRPANDKVESAWADFCAAPTICGKFSMTELLRTTTRMQARDGNALWRMYRGQQYKHGLAIELIDISQLALEFHRIAADGKARVRFGVEQDEFGKPLAYYFYKSNPHDEGGSKMDLLRVPAADVIHFARLTSPKQTLGIPVFSQGIIKLRMHGMYEEAQIVLARMSAAKGGVIETHVPQENGDYLDAVAPEIPLEAGSFIELPPGKSVKTIDFGAGTEKYSAISDRLLRTIAGGLGISYVSLANDLTGVNYSSIRAGILEEREHYKWMQGYVISKGLKPLIKEWADLASLKGTLALPAAKIDRLLQPRFYPRRWPWVDPQKDIQASVLAINNGLTSRTRVCAENGVDFEELVDELSNEQDMLKERGVTLVTVAGAPITDTDSDDDKVIDLKTGEKPDAKKPAKGGKDQEAAAAAGEVQSTALNGAQVTALAELASQVAAGQLPLATAEAIATAAFPLVAPATIAAIFAPLKGFTPAPEPTTPSPAPAEPTPAA